MEHHRQCTQSLTSLIEQLIHSCDNSDNREVLQQMKGLQLHKYVSSQQSPSRSFGLKKSAASGSNSPKTPKHSIKASLFSFFERKNSPDESHSSFYVDLNQQDINESNQSNSVLHTDKTGICQSDALIQLGLDPAVSNEESASPTGVEIHTTPNDALVAMTNSAVLDGLELMSKSVLPSPSSATSAVHGLESLAKPVLNSGAMGM